MDAIAGVVGILIMGVVAMPGYLVAYLGLRSLRDEQLLRRRGVRVRGVAERRVRRWRTSIVYRFQDAAGVSCSEVSNTLAGLARGEPAEVELWYDPLGRARVRETLRSPVQTAVMVAVVGAALVWLWLCGSMIYELMASPLDTGTDPALW